MSTPLQSWQAGPVATPVANHEENWYAVHTHARHEKVVAQRLQEQGIHAFLPTVSEVRRWSDRKKLVEFPLFSCYVFARFSPDNRQRALVTRTDGVFQILGVRGEGTPIPEEQIESIRTLVAQGMPWSAHPFLKIGQRVRIKSGALDGVEGILVARNGENTLVVSVDVIQRSVAVKIAGYEVEAV